MICSRLCLPQENPCEISATDLEVVADSDEKPEKVWDPLKLPAIFFHLSALGSFPPIKCIKYLKLTLVHYTKRIQFYALFMAVFLLVHVSNFTLQYKERLDRVQFTFYIMQCMIYKFPYFTKLFDT